MQTLNFDRRQSAECLIEPLRDLWRALVPADSKIVVVHSSLLQMKLPLKGLKEVFIGSLLELADKGLTIALPAFTLSFCKGSRYHFQRSKSETGILSQWLLESKKVKRTPHPIYSFAVLGPRKEEIMSCKNTTTFSDDSTFGYFESSNTVFITLGRIWAATQIHRYEELAKVPYRYYKQFSGFADFGKGFKKIQCTMYVRNPKINAKISIVPLTEAFQKEKKIKSFSFCGSTCYSVRAFDLANICKQQLMEDPTAWLQKNKLKLNS